MRGLTQIASVLAVVAVASPGAAQEISFTTSTAGHVIPDDGFFLLSEDNGSVRGNLALGLEVYENLSVFVEYDTGTERGPLFETFDMDFTVHAARAGVQYRYPLLRWFHPYALLGIGAFWGDIDLETPSQTYDDTAFGMGAFALAGYELVWYFGNPDEDPEATVWQRLGIGIINDYGYTFGPSLEFSELRPDDDGGPAINLGDVSLSGFTWRIGLTIRYQL